MPNSLLNPQYFWPPHPSSQLPMSFWGTGPCCRELVAVFQLRQGARTDPQRDLSSCRCAYPPKALRSDVLCKEVGLKSLCTPLALNLSPQSGMKPCRLCLRSGWEITLIWSKIHVFIHDSPSFPCSWDAGGKHRPELRPVPAGRAAPMPC